MQYVLLRERLRVFREVIAAGGVTAAARRLHVSQPAVSARVRELERELAVRLFAREGTGLALTDAGRILAEYASRLADVEQDAMRALGELKGVHAGRLAVGASETPGHYLLIGSLGRFRALHPGVALDVLVANSATVAQRLKDGALDLGFVEGNVADPALTRRRFRDDRLRLVVAPSHPLARRRRTSVGALDGADFVMRDRGSAVRTRVDEALRQAGVAPRVALEFSSTEAVKRAVAAGLGISFVPEASLAGELASGTLASPEVSGVDLARRLWILRSARRPPSPAADALIALLFDGRAPARRAAR